MAEQRLRRVMALVLAVGAFALAGAQIAQAQTTVPPYPGPASTTSTTTVEQATERDLGSRGLGARFTVVQCGFRVDTAVTFDVNGVRVPGDTADSGTCVQETFEIQSQLVALSVNRVGNMLAVTGLAAGTNVVVVVNGQPVKIGPLGSEVVSVANGTAVNGAARTVTVRFRVLRASQVDGNGNLVRTGTTILKWSPLGAGLVAVGYMLVLVTRRRRAVAA